MVTRHPRSLPARSYTGVSTQFVLSRTAQILGVHPMIIGVLGTGLAVGLMTLMLDAVQMSLGNATVLVLAVTLGGVAVSASWLLAFMLREQVSKETKLRRLSSTDPLTGLANRRSLELHLAQEWDKARERGSPLSVLFIDIDHFKRFNDTLGHAAGDEVLIAVAHCVQRVARRSVDFVSRYGGEEFAVVLPKVTAEAATAMADAIRTEVQGMKLPLLTGKDQCITVSIGAATCDPDEDFAPTRLVEAADAQMYAAKMAGRNRVCAIALGEAAVTT
ncbi:GGDEF domain-containing protein [Caballeronia novacaledonica]|uniref:GGDEF domain-containing protein n=1 Tax=Caballeronia novacaledonica TaxID=1544861 RepID=A0ACB5QMY4_9BURK|nr:GGDEF domain-containing protein [Caballeronia novacaledonica]